MTKVFSLTYAEARDVVAVLEKIVGAKVAADERTNAVIAPGDVETLAIVEAIVRRLDEPVANDDKPREEVRP